jgi:murein DD-endopeptidase MepM/ murein hydrolase activator NlpD
LTLKANASAKQRFTLFQTKPDSYEGYLAVDPLETVGTKTYTVYPSAWSKEPLATLTLQVVSAYFQQQNLSVPKKQGGLEPEAGEMEAIEAFKNTVSNTRYWDAPPFRLPVSHCMNSPFGVKRFYNGVFSGNYHKGVDQKSPAGTPIKAITGGVVKIARPYQLHGGTVAVDHGQGLGSIYIHMSKILVKPNQVVKTGDTLGLVGSTGFAMGPHLHWGLYVFGIPVNPQVGFVNTTPCG